MRMRGLFLVVISMPMLWSCGTSAPPFTLYRNSPLDPSVRVHWATFDAKESNRSYNLNNCQMAARVLNANASARAEAGGQVRDPSFGFWCEPGTYKGSGPVPSDFPAAFPTDV